MAYTTVDNPELFFQAKTYTGTNSSTAFTLDGSENMQPDLVWLKVRSAGSGQDHTLYDSVRGATKFIESNTSNAEATGSNYLTSFDSNGFTLGNDQSHVNASGDTYVSWNWKAGTSFTNDASSTGIGSIDSSGSFNNDAGFSIVTYTGNGSSGATVKHGMNQKPSMFIIKDRDNSNEGWMVYHKFWGATKYQRLNETGAVATGSAYFNNTEPTSSVFTIGNNDVVNKSGDKYVTYCFAEKQGYSKFGSYVGNGSSSGTYIHLGFKPAFVLGRRSDSAGGWWILDSKRSGGFNLNDEYLLANDSQTEADDGSFASDFLSNGWKARATNGNFNASGGTYIYMAFAENPFVSSTGVPATAR